MAVAGLSRKMLNPPVLGHRKPTSTPNQKPYLEGQENLVSRLIIGICKVTIWVIGVINLLTKVSLTLQVSPPKPLNPYAPEFPKMSTYALFTSGLYPPQL